MNRKKLLAVVVFGLSYLTLAIPSRTIDAYRYFQAAQLSPAQSQATDPRCPSCDYCPIQCQAAIAGAWHNRMAINLLERVPIELPPLGHICRVSLVKTMRASYESM